MDVDAVEVGDDALHPLGWLLLALAPAGVAPPAVPPAGAPPVFLALRTGRTVLVSDCG